MGSLGFSLADLIRLTAAAKPRIFVSYHHAHDQPWYDRFVQVFGSTVDIFTDRSLGHEIDSDDPDYTRRTIREKHITGTSTTVVLCGAETWKRRWVDWEIQMTLNKEHALLGIALPTCAVSIQGFFLVPDRLCDNIRSGYATWALWPLNPAMLQSALEEARARAKTTSSIANWRLAMERSHS